MSDSNNLLPPYGEQTPSNHEAPPQEAKQYVTNQQVEKTNTLAIVSLVSSFFIGLVAVITGHIARKQIKERGEGGDGLAIAGLVIGYLQIAATVFGIIFALIVASSIAGGVTDNIAKELSSISGNSEDNSGTNGGTLSEVDANACDELLRLGNGYADGSIPFSEFQESLANLYTETQGTNFGMLIEEVSKTGDGTPLLEYCGLKVDSLL